MPISLTRCPTGLLYRVSNFFASSLISKILFNNAKNGANGNAATKIVTNPYCRTVKKNFNYVYPVILIIYYFVSIIYTVSCKSLLISKYSGKRLLGPHSTNL